MSHYYLDSSAFVKQYVVENGTEWIANLANPSTNNHIYTVCVSGAEIAAAFFLRVRTSSISHAEAQRAVNQFKQDFQTHLQIVEVTAELVESAMFLAETHQLRGYDAVQLAAGLALHRIRQSYSLPPLIFVSADKRLNKAALGAGIVEVIDPNDY